ncbi:hypothetical protein EGH24_07025 [Halonotius terrestris]|uniref:PGF-CTERM archaeal protein-sorting signal domain-containing protein n=1 Tax=Halonotius terrestris TaxID=2487750 RepID=A0A8J8TC75_9EURY|nr:PGF-CTERM sorting domain-containing protein [Halonotius terrestris]TQQ80903.1 hypothetical protein EGH24_07025 [Halonotius terrestris]
MRIGWVGGCVVLLLIALCTIPAIGAATSDVSSSPATAIDDGSATVEPLTTNATTLTDATTTEQPRPLSSHTDLTLTTILDRTPEQVGEVTATVEVDIPDAFTELELQISPNVTVTDTDGFSETSDGVYEWDEQTEQPSVTYRVDATERGESDDPEADGQYRFADTEDWSLVRIPPQPSISGRYTGTDEPAVVRETEIDGPGAAGDAIAFLGDYERRTHTAHGQTFTLIVPEAADLEASPDEIFEAVAGASDRLRVGDRDEEVFMIAAPTGEIDWAVRGLQTGDTDFWVQDSERLDTAANNWVHEYVHTRQDYEAETSFRWFTEGSATYYAALDSLQSGRIGFDRFQRFIAEGEEEPQVEATLSEPDTWENYANYRKGALIAGGIDRQIRLATDQEASLATVFRAINSHDGSVDAATFGGYVQQVAGEQTADEAIGATTTDALIPMWDADEHATAFGQQPAAFAYRFADNEPITVTSDGTTTTADTNVTLSVNDTLAVGMVVENVGGTVGDYELAFRVNETELTREGRLDPSETASHRFEYRFTEPGVYPVAVGDETLTVTVEESGLGSVDLPDGSDIPTDIETPGFGFVPAIAALLGVAGLRWYRRE